MGLNLIMFAPWDVAWIILFFFSAPPYEGLWHGIYNFWMKDLIDPYFIYAAILIELLWIGVTVAEWGKDDEAFMIVYPIIFLIIFTLFTPLTVALVMADSFKAINYFDADVIAAKNAYINGETAPAGQEIAAE